ncbi:MAG: hypothetical protein ABW061_05230 [Polyangiaceae bacterium]
MAIMALLTGVYHLGRRGAVNLLSDIVGVRVSLGALSAVEELVSCARRSPSRSRMSRSHDASAFGCWRNRRRWRSGTRSSKIDVSRRIDAGNLLSIEAT